MGDHFRENPTYPKNDLDTSGVPDHLPDGQKKRYKLAFQDPQNPKYGPMYSSSVFFRPDASIPF